MGGCAFRRPPEQRKKGKKMRYELTPCQLNRLNDYIRHLRLAACLIDTLVHDIAKNARPGLLDIVLDCPHFEPRTDADGATIG